MKNQIALLLKIRTESVNVEIDDYIWFDGNLNFCNGADYNICFSGGKDSAYMAYILANEDYDIDLHFVNTGMELPGMLEYAKRKLIMEEIKTFNNENDGYISICKSLPKIFNTI